MKKNLRLRLPVVMCLLVSMGLTTAHAQETQSFHSRFMIGPTVGINLSSAIFQPKIQQKLKIGYDGGIVLRYDAVPYAGLWLEVDYSTRGWKEVPEFYPDKFYEETLRFVNIPFMTHFMIGNGPFKFTIDGGAHFGFCLSESNENNFPAGGEPTLTGVYTKHHGSTIQNKFAWGIGGGMGAEYHFSKMVIGLRASYVYGLGELYDNSVKSLFVKSSEQIINGKAYVLFAF